MTANPLSSIPPLGPTTGQAPPPGGGRFKPIDPLRVLRRHIWSLVVLVVVGVLLGGGAWYALRVYAPQYTSTAQNRVQPVSPEAWGGLNDDMNRARPEVVRSLIQNENQVLMSEDTLTRALQQPQMRETAFLASFRKTDAHGNETLHTAAAVSALRGRVLSASIGSGTMMRVTATTPNAEDPRKVLRAVLEVYLNKVRVRRENESRRLRQVYLDEQQQAERRIERLSAQREQFLVREDLETLESRSSEATIAYEDLAQQRVQMELALDEAQAHNQSLQQAQQSSDREPTAQEIHEVESMPTIQRLDERVRNLGQEKHRLLARFGPEHYRIKDLQQQIEAARSDKQREVKRLLRERRAARLEHAAQAVENVEGRLTKLEEKFREASSRMTDFQSRLNRYERIESQLTQARQDKQRATDALKNLQMQAKQPDAVRVKAAIPPTAPSLSFPQPMVIIPGIALLVIAAGTGLLFLRELLDQRLRSPADVKLIEQTDMLGMLPDAQEDPSGTGHIESVVCERPNGLIGEAFRQVRTAVLGKMDRRGYKTMLISAAQPGAGTSSVAQNLACSVARHGRDVLLIDTNIRRPAQHKLAGVAQSPGLVEALQNQIAPERCITRRSDLPLSVMPVGDVHKAPHELLAGPALRHVLGQLETQYDMIILDAPPALLATDTQLLARQVDAMALIARADRDTRGMVQRMLRQLDGQRADVLGLILNAAHSSAGGYFRKSYREFYRYSNGVASSNGSAKADTARRLPADREKEHAGHN